MMLWPLRPSRPWSSCNNKGLIVRPGDLLHGDESGLLSVPLEIVESVLEQAGFVLKKESEYIDFLNSDPFSLEELKYLITH